MTASSAKSWRSLPRPPPSPAVRSPRRRRRMATPRHVPPRRRWRGRPPSPHAPARRRPRAASPAGAPDRACGPESCRHRRSRRNTAQGPVRPAASARPPPACWCTQPAASPRPPATAAHRQRPDRAWSPPRHAPRNRPRTRPLRPASGARPRAAKARSTSLATPSPTIEATSDCDSAARPRARSSRFSAAARSGNECTSVPSRSSSSVRITVLHSETGIEAAR